jgi:hypothetical protein
MIDSNKAAAIADRIAATDEEQYSEPLALVDGALTSIIAALIVLDTNLPLVEPKSVPQRAARDAMIQILYEALNPYTLDMVNSLEVFETTK